MPKTRKCAYCGKVFTTNSGMQKYCSEECAEQAKENKKKRQRDFLRAVEPVMSLEGKLAGALVVDGFEQVRLLHGIKLAILAAV